MPSKTTHKLNNSRHFGRVLSEPEIKIYTPAFLVFSSLNDVGNPRLGMIIAKKHVKSAVRRNTIKRIIRTLFRQQLDNTPAMDIVVLALKGVKGMERPQLWETLQPQWEKLLKKSHSR